MSILNFENNLDLPAVSPDWVLWSCLVRNEAKREGEIGPLKDLFSYKLNSTAPWLPCSPSPRRQSTRASGGRCRAVPAWSGPH